MYQLHIGNKNYSSWSLRSWLLMHNLSIPFEEGQAQVAGSGPNERHRGYSQNGLVPCLHVDGFQIWDTLAIFEYLHEHHTGVWPHDPLHRARARSIAAEMHSGFAALRSAMPMNIKLSLQGKTASAEVTTDITRISEIWTQTREEFGATHGSGEPYLFGDFCAADAMFSAIIWRLHTYNVELTPVSAHYQRAMLSNAGMRVWQTQALAEKTSISSYDLVAKLYGGAR